ncbi:LysR family transcriptional regulator [Phaeobacter sp. HS012]|uniref:LysR family transcriptional regulator n=1 Tax=Phaeobacter TaxID=302485 RepID=UPI001B37BA98|nr:MULTISPECIES: LysR family transcriptional regulator [Phaeobacter]MBQ4806172.1 LysR family transcriptional regulator [Phaeobacter sp. HS012]MBQ4881022.1 LysR family transcriptional regulator [Phaeobacter sp. HS011]UWR66613.1 LysR family transcriptional regulator [Phaeobacter inhibens]UWS06082.1 LysR family transcriptional regulator [Phaeobacter inhibens]
MDIIWLRDFEALTTHKNFSRAAEERNVSQPAFSRRIRALEDEVGVKLINRQTFPLSLTPAGDVFLSQAKIILRTYSETLERCQTIDAAGENVIRFASSQSLYMTHFRDHIEPLMEAGGLDVDLNSTSWAADQFVTALQQRYCDVILTYWHPAMDFLSPLEVSKCDYLTLSEDEFIPVSKTDADGSPLFDLRRDPKRQIPLLSYGSASALRSVLDHTLRQQISPPNLLVVNQNSLANSVKAMILEGFGLGWLPRKLCQAELTEGRLAVAGGEAFVTPLSVRLYRETENSKPTLNSLWRRMGDSATSIS